jgi:ketopantoate reductase
MGRAVTDGGRRLPVVENTPARAPAAFQRIAVVGLGAVGGSIALAVRRAWPQALVIGIDTHDVVEMAVRLHAIDVGSDDLALAGDADLVVLAAGAEENARALPYLADVVAGDAVVFALGDSGPGAGQAPALPARLPLVAGVPSVELRGRGLVAARADPFEGRPWTVSAVTAGPRDAERVRELVRALGAAV